jgi:hypothetical protein
VTQPVQEPLTQRSISKLNWDTNQLYRRPTPSSESGIPGFHAYRESTLTMVTGVNAQINFDYWINDDDSIFEAGALAAGDLTEVKLLVEGWYSVFAWIHFSTQPTAGFSGINLVHDDTDIFENRSSAQGVVYPMNWTDQAAIVFSLTRYWPPVFLTQEPPNFSWVDRCEMWAIHNHGTNRTLDGAFLEFGYLGPRESTPTS